MSLHDEISPEDGRRYWGWFGDPWPSYICYDDDGRLIEEMHTDFPEGLECQFCEETIQPGDSGQMIPHLGCREVRIRPVHKECMLRSVLGSVECMKGNHGHASGKTYREEALEVWAMRNRRLWYS